ncbi:polysaccharide deacetylase family protein [uncultured Propionivibrio sp.]|uniref:polysaccharide deacetylase family protein n=1 Tax=uncultured Propionivibrio sp. TaxID=426737 RepID=UPI0029C0EE0C|nr:polysaccharide deacetylase family protein [uncultured Propionivibrio sp.]
MRCRRLIAACLGLALAGATDAAPERSRAAGDTAAFVFANVSGPAAATEIPTPIPAAWQSFDRGEQSRLAVLLTDTDSSWLSLAHGLRTTGIPFRLTRDVKEALRHRVVMVYPTMSGRVLDAEAYAALSRFPDEGGTLIGVDVEGDALGKVFGFTTTAPSRARSRITFDAAHALSTGFTDAREQTIPFSNPRQGAAAFGSLGYVGATAPLAVYDDGSAAITERKTGKGSAIAIGIDLGFLFAIGYNNREEGVARDYANGFEPAIDVLLRLIGNIYRAGEPNAVTLHTVPQGKALTVLMTHDVDYTQSLANALAYARFEAEAGVPATYFVQTKYVRDWNDAVFFNDNGIALLKELAANDIEIGSHSVAHSMLFHQLPLGSGRERYPDYRPFVRSATRTDGATIFGELRVSRFLLEHFVGDGAVVSFRPGHLRNPYAAPQAMQAVGYRYSSSATANNSLTHLPFRLTYDRAGTAEVDVFEFPVGIEDEAAPRLLDRLPQAVALAGQLARYGGTLVVLIHPDITGHKLEFEKRFVAAVADRAWFGSMRAFGDFWAARDAVDVDIRMSDGLPQLHLHVDRAVPGLTLVLPSGHRAESVTPSSGTWRQDGTQLVIDLTAGDTIVRLRPTEGPP